MTEPLAAFVAWSRNMRDGDRIVVVPHSRPATARDVNTDKVFDVLRHYTAANIERLFAKQAPAARPKPIVGLVLCHDNVSLERYRKAGHAGHYGHERLYKNKFIDKVTSYARLSEADFGLDDDPLVFMTYGQACKLLGMINANLAMRQGAGENVASARLCFATHIFALDSWKPTIDSALFFAIFKAIAKYGCLRPRLVHVSHGPMLSASGAVHDFRQRNIDAMIDVNWRLNERIELRKEHVERASESAANLILTLLQVRAGNLGIIYVFAPDRHSGNIVRKGAGSASGADDRVRVVNIDQLASLSLMDAIHLIFIPYVRVLEEYTEMPSDLISAAISMSSSFLTLSGEPLGVTVLRGPYSAAAVQKHSAMTIVNAFPIDPEARTFSFINGLPEQNRMQLMCRMALASLDTSIFPESFVQLAADRGLVTAIGNTVTRMQPLGIFTAKISLTHTCMQLLHKWQALPYGLFPCFVIIAILERYINHAAPLITAGNEKISAIVDEFKTPDPMTLQIELLCKFFEKFRLEVVGLDSVATLASEFGADPSELLRVVSHIKSLMFSGISKNVKYGPFNPADAYAIIEKEKLFPVATYMPESLSSSYSYCAPGDKIQYKLPTTSPYEVPTRLIVFYSEKAQNTAWEVNAAAAASLELYASLA
jgi:hypothetical protein